MIEKQQLREEIYRKRKTLDFQWLKKNSQTLEKRIRTLEEYRRSMTVGIYMPLPGEPDLRGLLSDKKHFCVPVYKREQNCYFMAAIDQTTRFHAGRYGIQEPVHAPEVDIKKIDLILVPGVAFDSCGNRLGHGCGYFDRLLKGFNGITLGVAFNFQLLPRIPHHVHDIRMHIIVTEKVIVKVLDKHST